MKKLATFFVILLLAVGGLTVVHKSFTPTPQPQLQQVQPQKVEPPPAPKIPVISVTMPNYLPYPQIVSQLDQWNKEASDLTERGNYGSTSKGQKIHYIRVTNLLNKSPKKVVMITGCIHGNEPLATSTVMAWIGSTLSQYGKDKDVTELLNTRDIYFVPVVSPDSYPNSRHVDGVDPNRNFPCPARPNTKSVPPIKSIQEFFLKIRPNAAISCHTWGRYFLTPWGDSTSLCPDNDAYRTLMSKMSNVSRYTFKRACEVYGQPIYGGELDWYYRNGAFSIVIEMGTHQRIPSSQDINTEFGMTFRAMLIFVREAPLVQLKHK